MVSNSKWGGWLVARLALVLAGIWPAVPTTVAAATADDGDSFVESRVRPVLIKHCLKCHGAEKQEGDLRLDTRAGWQRGGSQGPALVAGKPQESLLIKAISHDDSDLKMPPDRPLSPADRATLTEWVNRGAPDPRTEGPVRLGGMTLDAARAWWSFQPIQPPKTPALPAFSAIDAFLLAKMAERNLAPAPAADRRTLIRRVTYDLTGLPPTAEEVEAFAQNESPLAYRRLVDRLLASPAYGERWGRHWLDLVRYADTAGENSDHPVPQAWRYRNWVINAFNADQPYDAFIRDQVAGDLRAARSEAGDPEAVVATGFLAIARRFGHDIDKDMHLTREDVVDTLGKSVLGLSLGCARCHAHKFDPISFEDYYALDGIFSSTKFAFPGCEPKQAQRDLVPAYTDAQWKQFESGPRQPLNALDAERKQRQETLNSLLGPLQETTAANTRTLSEGAIDDGKSAAFTVSEPVQVEPGQALVLAIGPRGNHGADTTRITWRIEAEDGSKHWDSSEDLIRNFNAGNPHADAQGNARVWWLLDYRAGFRPLDEPLRDHNGQPGLNVWRNGDTPSAVVNATDQEIAVWTKLPPQSLFVHPAPDGPVALAWVSPVSARVRIQATVADGHPGGSDGVSWQLNHLTTNLQAPLAAVADQAEWLTANAQERAALEAALPKRDLLYGVTEGTPADAPVLLRGDPEKPGPITPRRWLEVLGGTPLKDSAGSGRQELADWITSPANPLTPRVLVNRLWQHHLGAGIVRTPNDFGSRGQAPSHPELLDWLATELFRANWQLKPLHRAILFSNAYQQSSLVDPTVDPENLWLARFSRRRLSIEELRDSLLQVSGTLERSQGGPHPFPAESSWGFSQHGPFAASYPTNRRSLYIMLKRNRRDPLFALFDGADPNSTTPERSLTTVPTQALFFLNDPFFHEEAAKLVDQVLARHSDEQARLEDLFQRTLQRPPQAADLAWTRPFLASYRTPENQDDTVRRGWQALARVLLGSNEFLYLD